MTFFGVVLLGFVALCFAFPAAKAGGCGVDVAPGFVPPHPKGVALVDTALFENFDESDTIPHGWTTIDGDGDGYPWFIYIHSPHSEPYSAGSIYNPTGNDDWLITPQIHIGSNYYLDFWYASQDPDWLETMEVLVSTGAAVPEDFTDLILTHAEIPTEWQHAVIDLSAYEGMDIYVAFHNISVDEFILKVDDVMVGELAPHDVTVEVPESVETFYSPGDAFVPSVVVSNFGASTETFDLHCWIVHAGDTLYHQVMTVSGLSTADVEVVDFPPYTLEGSDWVYEVIFFADVAGDATADDNTVYYYVNTYTSTERKVFFQEFTATTCYYCPRATMGLHMVENDLGDDIIIAAYHSTDYFGDDDFYLPELEEIDDYYGITGYPTVVVNGSLGEVVGGYPASDDYGYDLYIDAYNAAQALATAYTVELEFTSFSSEGCDIRTTVTKTAEVPPDADLRLRYAVVETDIPYVWGTDTDTPMDSIYDVVRDLVTSPDGVALSGDPVEVDEQHIDFDPSWNLEHCFVIAYVQNDATREIYNAVKVPLPVGVAESDVKPSSLSLTCAPNPFNASLEVSFALPSACRVRVDVCDLSGRVVQALLDGMLSSGAHTLRWDGTGALGESLPSGVYVIRLFAGGNVLARRVVMVR